MQKSAVYIPFFLQKGCSAVPNNLYIYFLKLYNKSYF